MEKRKLFINNKYIYDFIILFCIFIFIQSFPLNLFITNENIKNLINLILQIFLVIFTSIYIRYIMKINVIKFSNINFKNIAYFFPFIIIFFLNVIYSKNILNENLLLNADYLKIVILALKVLSEEIIFRILSYKCFKFNNPYKYILISSFVFSFVHLLNFINGYDPSIFLQVAYTFLLGLTLSLIYFYTSSILVIFLFHFLFNLLNQEIFNFNYLNMFSLNYIYFIIVIILSLFLYSLLILNNLNINLKIKEKGIEDGK